MSNEHELADVSSMRGTLGFEGAFFEAGSIFDRRDLLSAWKNLSERGRGHALYAHPDWVAREARKARCILFAGTRDSRQDTMVAAVLMPKQVQIPYLMGKLLGVSGKGWYLSGFNLLGEPSPSELSDFCRMAVEWLNRVGSYLFFEEVGVGSPLEKALLDCPGGVVLRAALPQIHHKIVLPKLPSEYWSKFGKNGRKNFKKLQKRAESLSLRLEEVRNRDQVRRFVENAARVSKLGWKTKSGIGSQVLLEGFESDCLWLADLGALRSYLLIAGEKVIAYRFSIQWKGEFIGHETAFDPAYGSYSPGMILNLMMLQQFFTDDTPQVYNLGFGDGFHKRMFSNWQGESSHLILLPETLEPSLAFACWKASSFRGGGWLTCFRRSESR